MRNHLSTQVAWKWWLQGISLTSTPSSYWDRQMQHSCMWKQMQIREVLTYSITTGFYIWCKQPKASVHPMFLMMLKYEENAKTVINILSFSSTLESSDKAYSECKLCISTK
jgi:hypothetical protein